MTDDSNDDWESTLHLIAEGINVGRCTGRALEHIARLDQAERYDAWHDLGEALYQSDADAAVDALQKALTTASSDEQRQAATNSLANALRHADPASAAQHHAALLTELTAQGAEREALIIRRNLARDLAADGQHHQAIDHLDDVAERFTDLALASEAYETHLDLLGSAGAIGNQELIRRLLIAASTIDRTSDIPGWMRFVVSCEEARWQQANRSPEENQVLVGLIAVSAVELDLTGFSPDSVAAFRLDLAESLLRAAVSDTGLAHDLASQALDHYTATGDGLGVARAAAAIIQTRRSHQ